MKQSPKSKQRDKANELTREEIIQREVDKLYLNGRRRREIIALVGDKHSLSVTDVDRCISRAKKRYLPIINKNREELMNEWAGELLDFADRMDRLEQYKTALGYRKMFAKTMGLEVERIEVDSNMDVIVNIGQ